jgi:hypothetical protein
MGNLDDAGSFLSDHENYYRRRSLTCPKKVYHIYFGNETGDNNEFNFHITFNEPCYVRISNGDPRCYVHIERLN